MSQAPTNDARREFLTFSLGDEEYAIDILHVREIRAYAGATRIANAPAYVKGVINLRGTIVPIVDLRLRFGFDERADAATRVAIILSLDARPLGLVVDAVSDVLALAAKDIRPAPEQVRAVMSEAFVQGLAPVGDRMLIVVEPGRILARERLEEAA